MDDSLTAGAALTCDQVGLDVWKEREEGEFWSGSGPAGPQSPRSMTQIINPIIPLDQTRKLNCFPHFVVVSKQISKQRSKQCCDGEASVWAETYLRRGRACRRRGRRGGSVRPGSWAAESWDRTGSRGRPPGPPTPSDSTAPSRPGSVPWGGTRVLFLCYRPRVSIF